MLGERALNLNLKSGAIHLGAARYDDCQLAREQAVEVEIVERGKEHEMREVARRAEQHQCFDFHAQLRSLVKQGENRGTHRGNAQQIRKRNKMYSRSVKRCLEKTGDC